MLSLNRRPGTRTCLILFVLTSLFSTPLFSEDGQEAAARVHGLADSPDATVDLNGVPK